jgi:hypothetical protein
MPVQVVEIKYDIGVIEGPFRVAEEDCICLLCYELGFAGLAASCWFDLFLGALSSSLVVLVGKENKPGGRALPFELAWFGRTL